MKSPGNLPTFLLTACFNAFAGPLENRQVAIQYDPFAAQEYNRMVHSLQRYRDLAHRLRLFPTPGNFEIPKHHAEFSRVMPANARRAPAGPRMHAWARFSLPGLSLLDLRIGYSHGLQRHK